MIEAFCTTCQRTTYVRKGAELACPVCASALVEIKSEADSQTG
jgi:Zn finger protein HypA/HybF involved in hydrogenase expression